MLPSFLKHAEDRSHDAQYTSRARDGQRACTAATATAARVGAIGDGALTCCTVDLAETSISSSNDICGAGDAVEVAAFLSDVLGRLKHEAALDLLERRK